MEPIQFRVIDAGLFFLFIFLSGYLLSRSEKPYNALIFNIHKLIGLATGIFLGVTVYQFQQGTALSSLEITAIVVTIFLFTDTVIAGGLVSIEKPMPVIITTMHKVLPYLTTLSAAVTLYLLLYHK